MLLVASVTIHVTSLDLGERARWTYITMASVVVNQTSLMEPPEKPWLTRFRDCTGWRGHQHVRREGHPKCCGHRAWDPSWTCPVCLFRLPLFRSFTATQSPKSFPLSSLNHSRKPPNMNKGCRLLLYRQINGSLGDRDLQWVPELGQSCETEHRAYGICVHSRESELEPS